jgi:putative ABC transport system permease protein
LGRTFAAGEEKPGQDRVVVISYDLWQSAFGGDEALVGRSILLDDESYTVIGILPADFYSAHFFAVQPDLWVPLSLIGEEQERRVRNLVVYGRLAPGRNLQEAQSAMDALAVNLAQQYPETNRDWAISLVPVQEDVVGNLKQTFFILLAAVGLVLLIACANVANMVLTRASERSREIALRTALGAGRGRLLRQILTESLLLAGAGGLLGILIALLGVGPMVRLIPSGAGVPFLDQVRVDSGILAFALLATLLTGVLFGLAPAWQVSRWNLNDALKEGGRAGIGGPRAGGTHRFLVTAQLALSLILLAGAGLILQSFQKLSGYDPGFDAQRILTLRNSLRGAEFQDPARRTAHFEELASRLGALPGVESASAVSFAPPIGRFLSTRFEIDGQPADPGHEPSGAIRIVLPGYFDTMGIPVAQGRAIDGRDRSDSLPVALVNRTAVQSFFAGRDPLGATLKIDDGSEVTRQVVGVVGDVRCQGIDPRPRPVIYIPHSQSPNPIMNLVLRTSGDPLALARSAERVAWQMNGSGNVYGIAALDRSIADQHWRSRLISMLLTSFALLALCLGAAGLYGVISSSVSKRIREMAIRMALGAGRSHIHRLVLGEGLKLAAVGIAVGLLASLVLTRLITNLLYGVTATDPLTFGLVAALLMTVAFAAALAPARRATRADPMAVLRAE